MMKLEFERKKSDTTAPITLFFRSKHGRYEIDPSMHDTSLMHMGKMREVEIRLIRPTGFFDKLLGGADILYIRIKTIISGTNCKGWLCSSDDGKTWGMVKKLPTKTFEVLDILTFEV